MRTRPVHADELDLFVEAAGSPDRRQEARQYLESMFAAGSMRPEWCFVAEEEGDRPLGRVAFWTLPGTEEPFALVLLDVPWDGDHKGVGTRLLEDVLNEARRLGAKEIEHVIDAPPRPPFFQDHPEERAKLLEAAGFAPRRETDRFEWRGGGTPAVPGRLAFRTQEETGEKEFVDAIRRVSEGTLDGRIRGERERLGPERAARAFFDAARGAAHEPSWWRLAYEDGATPDGEPVGLVMMAAAPSFSTVYYVGVAPEKRGRGYVGDLLAAGTAALLETGTGGAGAKPLIADADVPNAPMAAAFVRAGWTRFGSRREYVADPARALPAS